MADEISCVSLFLFFSKLWSNPVFYDFSVLPPDGYANERHSIFEFKKLLCKIRIRTTPIILVKTLSQSLH